MSQQGQWQVAGSAPEVYERELVPAVFGVGLLYLWASPDTARATACSMSRAAPELWRGSPRRASVQPVVWSVSISIPEC